MAVNKKWLNLPRCISHFYYQSVHFCHQDLQITMEDITDVSVEPVTQSSSLKPTRINFTQNGRKRFWDIGKIHTSVACILFNTSRNVFVMVKQFRPAVYLNVAMKNSADNSVQNIDWTKVPGKCGVTIEFCGGMENENCSPSEVIKKEVLGKCRYNVPLENFQEVKSYRSSGDRQTIFYAECTDEMRVTGGSLAHEEIIETVEMTVPQAREYMNKGSIMSPCGMLVGLMWFFTNKVP